MKLLIASDIHGAAGYCRDLLAAWDREGADRLLLLGDLLYHGPRNDLPPDYAPKEVIALLNARKNQIFCVRGNCDTEVDQMVLEFPVLADYAVLTAAAACSTRPTAMCTTRPTCRRCSQGTSCCTVTRTSPPGRCSGRIICISTPARSPSPRQAPPTAI